LFDAGAHVAGGELDEVFGFVRGGAAEEIEKEAEFGGWAAGFSEVGECGFYVGEGEGGRCGCVAVEEVGSGCSEVAVTAVGGGQGFGGGSGELGNSFAEEAATDVENASVRFGEGGSREP
jgi:hypothetical protein